MFREIKTLPFYYKTHDKKDNGGKPHFLPFNIIYDTEFEMFRQVSTPELKNVLQELYSEGSLIEGSTSRESGNHYISKIRNYIMNHFPSNGSDSILEIGFGSGALLKELKKSKFTNLIGIEPGSHNLVEDLDGIKLINDYYPSKLFQDTVDLILHFGVLEHIEDPFQFIKNQVNQLHIGGKLIFFVPNEEPFYKTGDISTFTHEHFSYFTKFSVYTLIKKANLYVEDISIIDGMLAITATKTQPQSNGLIIINNQSVDNFSLKLESQIEKMEIFFENYWENDVALYVPGRALNIMHLINRKNLRLVDDSSEVHGKYLPFFNSKIESFEELLANPPKVILIFSRTFGTFIKKKCLSFAELNNTRIISIEEFDLSI